MRKLLPALLLAPLFLFAGPPVFAQARPDGDSGPVEPAPAAAIPPAADPAPEVAALAVARRGFELVMLNARSLGAGAAILAAASASRVEAAFRVAAAPTPVAVVRRGGPLTLASRGGAIRRVPDELLGHPGVGPLQGKRVCVDAGHGGFSLGAQGLNGLKEKDACLAMAAELAQALQDVGATVIMPRVDDTYVSLDDRIDFANSQSADLFVSIHCNAMPTPNTVSGSETYYYTPQSARLAQCLHPALVGAVAGRDGGIRRRAFAVIRRTSMPSVLLEVAYINHEGDEARLADPDFRFRVGQAVRDGVLRYFTAP